MREIKFRAWDKDRKKIICPVGVESDGKSYRCVSEGFAIQYDPEYKPYDAVMQYTGLKDKNGVEIYDGDILKCRYYKKNYSNYIIEYDEFPAADDMDCAGIGYKINCENGDCEVIGNIYENPELLKENSCEKNT